MTSDDKPFITFGSQMGDTNSAEVVQPHLIQLRKLLKEYCNYVYATEVDEFAPILRVDGDIFYWEFEGFQNLRLSKKQRYITVDIGMPRSKWQGVNALEIRKFLMDNLVSALKLISNRLKKEKYIVDEERLFSALSKVEQKFLFN